ncbi:6350_t:CDS:2, partial [Racocetra fulgida]
ELDDILFDLQEKYGSKLFEFYISSERKICIGDANLLEDINKYSSSSNFKSRAEFELDELAGKGIGFNNNLESWKHNKAFLAQSIMTPSFWKEYIKEIEMIFEDSIKLMESKQQSSSFDIDFKEWAVRLLAIEGYTKEPISKELSYKINIWIKSIIFHRLLPKFIATYVPPFNLFKKKYLKNDEWLKKYFDDLVEKRREEINQMKKYNSDILTTLICANTKNKLKDEEIRIIIYETFIGISTVYAEIDKVFYNDKTRPITYDDISTIKLPYTEACVNESLRLISTVLYTL